MASFKTITLISSDAVSFVVEQAITGASVVIKDIVEDIGIESPILLPNVKAAELTKIVQYFKRYYFDNNWGTDDDVRKWNREFFSMPVDDLVQLLYAANYVHMQILITACCDEVSKHIEGRSPEYIRVAFHITDECTPEQAEELRLEREWAFSQQ